LAAPTFVQRLAAALAFLVSAGFAAAEEAPLKVAVYDAPPYGHVEPDGSIDGLSVDLWRRAAESLGHDYRLAPVAQMEEILKGLERKDYRRNRRDHDHARPARASGLQLSDASFGGRGRGPPGHRTHGRVHELRRCHR
jgi:hypothetical protein